MTLRKLILEDLTKTELVKLVRESFFYQPTQRELLKLRWESMTEEANRIMIKASEESQKYWRSNITKWNAAQKDFDKGLVLSDKVDILFKELYELKDG